MKRIIIDILTAVFAVSMLVFFKSSGEGMNTNEKALFFLLLYSLFIIRILGEFLYLWYVSKMLNTSVADEVPFWSGLKTIRDKEFACPNCGGHFKKKWWLYTFSFLKHRAIALFTFGKTNFRCPHCKKYDTCVVVEKDN